MKLEFDEESKVTAFYNEISKSDDLEDNLDLLATYLQSFTKATGVYIGKLVVPKKEITEDDDDRAHIDEENAKVIYFQNASADHAFMLGKILKSD